mmetsp:Transcript_12899/g.19346  ORF Transcript_12899/g.19346 Transcript_12899/m.19346 type:complete len:1397 (-) Transcript_12899:25-4215(-)|eukprot:CAMPEP_0194116488 /NCGR_PEP_ID=MMETSP0150-20130528/27292_1 /TAXON_ID=122233 /ORGANISM="Chaetoceros debilis, Strain MM31A-1" /LENGTH=1396 /DNA_ID=CAMNT_0038807209 /DNA_START=63 /DNA_END=4253 /DNA_ORIENTATION=+
MTLPQKSSTALDISALIYPGSVILTSFGVAVVIHAIDSDSASATNVPAACSSFKARIWRQPGKSVASSTTAYLQKECAIKALPAAPGMATTKIKKTSTPKDESAGMKRDDAVESNSEEKIMIHCYSREKDEYVASRMIEDEEEKTHLDLISSLSLEDEHDDLYKCDSNMSHEIIEIKEDKNPMVYLKPSEVDLAKSAKFYPLMDELIRRGNAAAALAKSSLKDNSKLMELADKISASQSEDSSDKSGEKSSKVIPDIGGKVTEVTEKVTESLKKGAQSMADPDKVDGIYNMLKDEELTVLLSNGRERLRHLVSGGLTESTRDTLKEMGLEISNDSDGQGVMSSAILQAREKALGALDELLEDNLEISLDTVQETLGETFGTMFDSMVTAAKSDGALDNIMDQISSKTSEWQKETGRLLSTRSSSLFMEGAQRLQGRLGNLLSPQQLALVEKSGADLTKAFTEGDVALAQLKSIELGESVRTRLFNAIEIRSGTEGGLDSIIAGALSQIGGDSVGQMLADFQNTATANSTSAHESLISLLSERNKYQDVSILRIESVFVDLDAQMFLTAEQIVAISKGESGTSALFEPIAKRAAKEIEKQLDEIEQSVDDPTILSVISHVRRIMSGNLTLTSLVDEIVNVMNSEDAVQAGTSIAQAGEQILDTIENASTNKAFSDVLGAAEKAGITKDSVLGQIESLNVDEVLDTAGEAVADEKKRFELIGAATDSALDFLLRILPSMPVPPFEGVRDGLIYAIKNLSMHGFKLRKEDIMVEIAGIRAAVQTGSGSDAIVQRKVKATDILVVDVRNVSATFENAQWSFEQTFLPYLKGNGLANVQLSEGHIRLEFELKKTRSSSREEAKPVLCLKKRSCSIGQVAIAFGGKTRLAWVVNKLAAIFKGPLRDYVVKVITDILGNKSGWLLENLNGVLSAHWGLILKTTGLNVADLDEVNENDIVASIEDPYANEIDLVWTEFVPLGINLLLSDKSGKVKVVDFPRGSQARKVCVDKDLDPDAFKGATILGINGTLYEKNANRVDMLLALRDPSRPKTVKFKLLDVDSSQSRKSESPVKSPSAKDEKDQTSVRTLVIVNEGPIGITFANCLDNCALSVQSLSHQAKLTNANTRDQICVGDILTHVNGTLVYGQEEGSVERAYSCLKECGLTRPLSLSFMPDFLHSFAFEKYDEHGDPLLGGPNELILGDSPKYGDLRIRLKGFKDVDGCAESRGVFLGDHVCFVNGVPVGSGAKLRPDCPSLKLSQVNALLNNESTYPMCITFARPNSRASTVDFDAESLGTKNMSIIAISKEQLGFTLGQQGISRDSFVVKNFNAVRGSFQKHVKDTLKDHEWQGLSVYSIHGERVPSYANCEIVMNAIKRAQSKNDRLELVFCNADLKQKISELSDM